MMHAFLCMGLLLYMWSCGLHMFRKCRESFPRHRLQRKPLVNYPDMHHGTYVTRVLWCMMGSLTRGGGGNVPGILGACATHSFSYLARGSCRDNGISGISSKNQLLLIYWIDTTSPRQLKRGPPTRELEVQIPYQLERKRTAYIGNGSSNSPLIRKKGPLTWEIEVQIPQ